MDTIVHDLGLERGLSRETLQQFNVRANGTGWLYDFKCSDGKKGTRWKSYYSTESLARDNGHKGKWEKYLWPSGKPDGAKYFYPTKLSLTEAVLAKHGQLWLVGGDIAGMTMIEAGIFNSVSTFGDHLPNTFTADLKAWGVHTLYVVPDRDESGLKWAIKVRDALIGSDVILTTLALPYPLESSKGKDVNDFWCESDRNKDAFFLNLTDLQEWTLPEPEPPAPPTIFNWSGGQDDIPPLLKAEIRQRLGVHEVFNNEGWSRKNVRCPFHDDKDPSATWNDEKGILHCHAGCGKTYLVKDLCEFYGLHMADYYEQTPEIERAKSIPLMIVPKEAPAPIPHKPTKTYAPPLSDFARLTAAQETEAAQGRKWLDDYMAWAIKGGPLSPDIFYEAMGLWTLSMVATRRLCVTIGSERIYPNLYIFIVAPTTVYRKTTALNIATTLISKSNLDFLLMPERATPEALLDYLAGKMPMNFAELPESEQRYWKMGRAFAAQRALKVDEASGLLSEMKKDYNAGLTEILLQGYDAQGVYRKILKNSGAISVKDMCFSMLAATTPVEWGRRMGIEERQNGFTARFAIITPEGPPIYRKTTDEVPIPASLPTRLWNFFAKTLQWDKRLIGADGTPRGLPAEEEVLTPPVSSVQIAPGAMKQIDVYRQAMSFDMLKAAGGLVEDDKAGAYSRLGTMMVKVAMLLAGIEADSQTVRIESHHAYAAQMICERWRESLHRLDALVDETRIDRVDDKILAFIRSGGQIGVTSRDIQRGCGVKETEAAKQVNTLIDAGLVEKFIAVPEGKSRSSIRFKVVIDS